MAATTISRPSLTDDDGSGTTGGILNSTNLGLWLYDKVDELFAAASTIWEGSTNGERHLKLVNTNNGTAAYTYIAAGNDAATYGSYQTILKAYGTGHSTLPDASEVASAGAGSLYLTANNAAASVIVRTGGLNERARVTAAGHLVFKELTANPGTADCAADAALALYTKADTVVFAYNNGGTMTYLTLALDGTTTTWSHGTTAP